MKYIYDTPQWPHFSWDHEQVSDALVRVNKEAGFLAGRLSAIGLDARMGAVVGKRLLVMDRGIQHHVHDTVDVPG